MRKKTHDNIAREIARILHLDEDKVLLGARLPDFDNVVGVHSVRCITLWFWL